MSTWVTSRGRSAVLGVATAVGAFLVGIILAAIGAQVSPLAIIAPVVVVGAVAVTLRAPKYGVSMFVLSIPIALQPIPGTPLQVVDLVAMAAIGLVVLARLLDLRMPLGWHPAMVWGLLLTGLVLLAVPTALDFDAAVGQALLHVVGALLVLAVIGSVIEPDDLGTLSDILLAVGGLTCLYALTQAGDLRSSFGGGLVSGRAQGIFKQPNELGSFAAMLLPLATARFLSAEDRRDRYVGLISAGASGLALMVSLSRGAWIGAGLGLVALLILLPSVRRYAAGIGAAVAVLLFGLVAVAPDVPQVQVVRDRFASIGDPSANPYDDRPAIYAEAVRQIRERPLRGFGPGAFPAESARAATAGRTVGATHAHNTLLTYAAELGLPSVALVIGFTLAVGWAALTATRKLALLLQTRSASVVAGAGAALFTIVGHGVVDLPQRNPILFLMAWYLVGMVLAGDRSVRRAL